MQFKVKVLDAILTHDTEIGSQMDPFCVLKLGNQNQQKTKIIDQGGDWPVWNEEFIFEVKNKMEKLRIVIYDEDMAVDDLVGEVSIDVNQILSRPRIEKKWYSLKYGPELRRPAGKVNLEFQTIGNLGYGGSGMQGQYAGQQSHYAAYQQPHHQPTSPNIYTAQYGNQPGGLNAQHRQSPVGMYSPIGMHPQQQGPQTPRNNPIVSSHQAGQYQQTSATRVGSSQQQSHYLPANQSFGHQPGFGTVSPSQVFRPNQSVQFSSQAPLSQPPVSHSVNHIPPSYGHRTPTSTNVNSSLQIHNHNQTSRMY